MADPIHPGWYFSDILWRHFSDIWRLRRGLLSQRADGNGDRLMGAFLLDGRDIGTLVHRYD